MEGWCTCHRYCLNIVPLARASFIVSPPPPPPPTHTQPIDEFLLEDEDEIVDDMEISAAERSGKNTIKLAL